MRFIDLFAGIGGFRLGLEAAGHECVYGAENNKHAALTYETNFGDNILRDITQVDPASIPDFDILVGGFPCQPFSKAGKGLGFEDTRGTLFFDVCRIIDQHQPEYVVLENVKALRTHNHGDTFKTIVSVLEQSGYSVATKVLNAKDFGVPQSRERMIIVGTKTRAPYDFDKVVTKPHTVLKDFILPPATPGLEWVDPAQYVLLKPEQVKTSPQTGLMFTGYMKATLRAGVKPGSEHLSRAHRQSKRIYSVNGTHPTISSQEKSGRYYLATLDEAGNRAVRKTTLDECYKLFGFPDTYKRVGALGEQYARIGNSICVPMVEAIVNQL